VANLLPPQSPQASAPPAVAAGAQICNDRESSIYPLCSVPNHPSTPPQPAKSTSRCPVATPFLRPLLQCSRPSLRCPVACSHPRPSSFILNQGTATLGDTFERRRRVTIEPEHDVFTRAVHESSLCSQYCSWCHRQARR
jgi:hypothetical protein